jgi:PKD repeat protein
VDGEAAPLYELQRFQENDLLAVPICQAGIFALTDSEPVVLLPEAGFSADLLSGLAPLSVQFEDLSLNATSWEWDFGDGSAFSYEQNPIHVYNTPGVYAVRLTVGNAVATDMVTKEAYIKVFAMQIFLPMLLK